MFKPGRSLHCLALPLLCAPVLCVFACSISPPVARALQKPSANFRFTKGDLSLLNQANAIDNEYEVNGLVLHDPGVQAYIDSVGNRVLSGRPVPEHVNYRFMVLRDPMVNAFSLANGSVYITTGMLALLQNQAQLAGVLSHESAHVYDRHAYLENRSISESNVTAEIILAAANWVPGGAPVAYGLTAITAAHVSRFFLIETVYGYSRDMEQKADSDGITAMTAAGYDPHAMVSTFKLLDQDSTLEYEPKPTFYHDHPELKEREAAALEYAREHTPPGAETGIEQDYLTNLAPAIASSIEADIESRRPRAAVASATRLVNAFPSNPKYEMLLGESYRQLGAKTIQPTPEELTHEGENRQRKQVLNMTEEQEQQKLASTPTGRATLQQNQAAAEKLFLKVIQENPDNALAYRELGFLLEDESRFSGAAANYQHYLQLLAPTSLDRLRIERRLAQCQSRQTAEVH